METIKLNIPTGIAQLVKHYENDFRKVDKIFKAMQGTASYCAFLRKDKNSQSELGVKSPQTPQVGPTLSQPFELGL